MTIAQPPKSFNSLALALAYVAKHPDRYIFPIKSSKKFPPLIRDMLNAASNDPDQIRKWVAKFGACNWGVALKKSRLLVVDVDTKEGKVGADTYDTLDMIWTFPSTETVRSPSGGLHHYYNGEHVFALGENGFGKDVDSPGYVVMAGCVFDDGTSYQLINDEPTADAPLWFYEVIKASKSKKSAVTNAGEIVIELDKPENIATVIDFLLNDAVPAIQGSGGDDNTFRTASYLKDLGMSVEYGAELLNEFYNPRCVPSWDLDDLIKKMQSAYAYGSKSKVGGKTAEADFADDPPPEITPTISAAKIAEQKADRAANKRVPKGSTEKDFNHYAPTNTFVFGPTRDMWPAGSINTLFGKGAAKRIAINSGVQQATWAPGLPMIIRNKLVSNGTWTPKPGASVLNLYRPPLISTLGDATKAGLWLDHIKKVCPDDWQHIVGFFAWRVQRPDVKVNHCIVLGGDPGIGKDTIIAGLRNAVGSWNCSECNPANLLGDYTAKFLQSVILRVNEARDMGEGRINRYDFYEGTKTMMADPPETLSVQAKYLNWYDIMNLVGLLITTNNKTNGLYLPADDRRHYVAWSKLTEADFAAGYFNTLWTWYRAKDETGARGFDHVAAYLRAYDLAQFDPKASPPKTLAFWEIVGANRAPEETELAGLLMVMGDTLGIGDLSLPDAITVDQVATAAARDLDQYNDLYEWLTDRKNRRQLAARFEKAGYAMTRNPDEGDGLWRVIGKRQTVYTLRTLSGRDAFKAVTALQKEAERQAARIKRARAKADKLSDAGGVNALA
jgi:hypothetical protein